MRPVPIGLKSFDDLCHLVGVRGDNGVVASFRQVLGLPVERLHEGSFIVQGISGSFTKISPTRKLVTAKVKASQPAQYTAWLLKGKTQLATVSSPVTLASTATLKLKPATALKPGTYVVQVKMYTSTTNFKVIRKKITVM